MRFSLACRLSFYHVAIHQQFNKRLKYIFLIDFFGIDDIDLLLQQIINICLRFIHPAPIRVIVTSDDFNLLSIAHNDLLFNDSFNFTGHIVGPARNLRSLGWRKALNHKPMACAEHGVGTEAGAAYEQ